MLEIRALQAEDHAAWAALYAGYAGFYGVEQTDAMRATVWGWLMDPAHGTEGLVAVLDGVVVGITHYRAFARPLSASVGGFLDDLFVGPLARGSGAAEALIAGVADVGRKRGWTLIRWITAEDNYRARGLYDRVAEKAKWVTYDIKL
ncbi:N-acetyltransferase [Cypionkella aquatica]|uniref:N-acetyltransferase n=1 Tax=Cypionkella aquatica TaxID=1756042 RepID=A0AA37U0N9_9RHOB|nr:GNAT family N-acetyltransferase [Cypionkella aquatica]GLS86581.1 N-acetyltransferase [Cypionkella aquatica]